MGTGTGGAKQSSGIETKGAGPYTIGRAIGIGTSDRAEATKTSAFFSAFTLAGACSSEDSELLAFAIFLHIAHGCLPSKVFSTACVSEPLLEKSRTIEVQATP